MHIKHVFLIILIFLFGSGCSTRVENIKGVQLSWKMAIFDKEVDSIFNLNGASRLYFYKNMMLYQKEGTFTHADGKEDKIYTYWMYKQSQKQGVRYNPSLNDIQGTTFNVDSFLVKDAFKNFPFFSKDNDSLVANATIKNSREHIEKYIPKTKPDDSYPDTMIFRFNKGYNDISYSFSHEMDGEKGKRLVEVTGVYNPIVSSKSKAQSQGRKISFLMERISVENQKEKLIYFKRFEDKIEELNLH
jgi:hypothetical protein